MIIINKLKEVDNRIYMIGIGSGMIGAEYGLLTGIGLFLLFAAIIRN